jgi:hypothetical protein
VIPWRPKKVLKMKTWIYWSESNSWISFYIFLNKNWNIYWSEQSFTGLWPEDRTKFYWSLARGQNKVLLVFGPRTEQSFTGLWPEDRTKFYWSLARGQIKVLLVFGPRTEQSFTGLWPEDRTKFYWSLARGQNKVLLVFGRGPVFIVRTVLNILWHYQ